MYAGSWPTRSDSQANHVASSGEGLFKRGPVGILAGGATTDVKCGPMGHMHGDSIRIFETSLHTSRGYPCAIVYMHDLHACCISLAIAELPRQTLTSAAASEQVNEISNEEEACIAPQCRRRFRAVGCRGRQWQCNLAALMMQVATTHGYHTPVGGGTAPHFCDWEYVFETVSSLSNSW